MLTYKEALVKIEETVKPSAIHECQLDQILGHILANPILATSDLPRFNNSAMDGYGVKDADVEKVKESGSTNLKVIDTIEAGDKGDTEIKPGEAVKIFTGAIVPESVDSVIMREHCEESTQSVTLQKPVAKGANIRIKGEEFSANDMVLPAGIKATPPVIGLLASFGYDKFSVYKKPTISIVGTGNELKKPGQSLSTGQIYDSNSFALSAAVESLGLEKPLTHHASDKEDDIKLAIEEAMSKSDVVITAGGVSVGDKDLVKSVLENKLGVETIFWRAKVKPGKPVYFGIKQVSGEQKLVFGLPGNPVSALVTFHLFVKPALKLMQGTKTVDKELWKASMLEERKKKAGRLDFVRATLSTSEKAILTTLPTQGQDSHMLSGLAKAECLIHFDQDESLLEKDSLVTVQELNWNSY